jgi:hypothetical protein
MSMKFGRYIAGAAMALIFGANERVADGLRGLPALTDFCEKQCSNNQCFVTRELGDIPVQGSFDIYVQTTQSIVKAEVQGRGYRAFLLRWVGANDVPGYPEPDMEEIELQDQFKTTNAVWLAGSIINGQVTLKSPPPPLVRARLGPTKVLGLDIGGKKFVDDRLSAMPRRYEHCILGAIARPVALVNLGRRIVIGSRIAFDVQITGSDSAIITPRVTYSRFPTTFIWLGRNLRHEPAHPLYQVLEHCEKWSEQ